MLFACHKTDSIAVVYQLQIKEDQDKFRAVFLGAKSAKSFPLEDKHVVNVHHVVYPRRYSKSNVRNRAQSMDWVRLGSIEFGNPNQTPSFV